MTDTSRVRDAIGAVLGREVPITEDVDLTAQDLERYVAARDAESPRPDEGAGAQGD